MSLAKLLGIAFVNTVADLWPDSRYNCSSDVITLKGRYEASETNK